MKIFFINCIISFAILFLYLMLNIKIAISSDYLSLFILWVINAVMYLFLYLIFYCKKKILKNKVPFSIYFLRVCSFIVSIVLIIQSFYEIYHLVILMFTVSIFCLSFSFVSNDKNKET